MNELKIFENEQFGSIRTVEVNGTPYFVGKDVAEVLGYSNTRDALAKHTDDEDKSTVAFHDGSQNRNVTVINESGLYSLILSSKLPKAKDFKHWVTSDVLPTLRKTGEYKTRKTANPELAKIRADAMMLNAKSRFAKQMTDLWTAAGVKPEYQALALNGYVEDIALPREAFKEQATALYDATTIAEHLGIMSKSGKPHAQAVGAIISRLTLNDDEWAMTPYSRNGHDSESIQYTLSVEHKVKQWLEENNYPNPIQGNGKNYTVKYKSLSRTV